MLAMDVNDGAGSLTASGVLETIVGTPPGAARSYRNSIAAGLSRAVCRTQTATTPPCAIAYNYARIRRLVRLDPGLYRFHAAANSAAGFSDPIHS
jgi:hypothetical protein